ncbi:hypothetical protein NQ318_003788 [Aromia moschata]|uniref:Zinc finger protein n=1 Tax=Aromia moschata TaxID=1265417 RepID=A0AAV8YJE0_9CUCU|nr:hypothetical protein NQ318_003788 [Aromia moschata]
MDVIYDTINIHSTCRVCLNQDSVMVSFFNEDFIKLFEEITGLKFNETDPLPKLLCGYCVDKLKNFKQFKLTAIENESILRSIIKAEQSKAHYTEGNTFLDTVDNEDTEMHNYKISYEARDDTENKSNTNTATKFECNICRKGVKTIHSLRRHMKIHTGVKPHECSFCGKRFFGTRKFNKTR